MPKLILDLDDTLCDISHRKKFYGVDWDKYNALMKDDKLVKSSLNIVNALEQHGFRIVILTGRYEKYLNDIKKWLHDHTSFSYEIHCKPDNDNRSSIHWKKEWLIDNIEDGDYVFDDRSEIEKFCRDSNIGYIKPIIP